MVDDELRDGPRIAQLLSSEIHGHERGALGDLSVVDADRDAEPSADGTFAYAVEFEATAHADGTDSAAGATEGERGAGRRVAEVYLHPARIRVEVSERPETAWESIDAEGLRAGASVADGARGDDEEGAVSVFVENGAAVKPALRVVRAVAEALREELGEP